ncbi:MAG: GWxTD domain-containing protein [bacterium]|nr:GWxTD domain-containing protein [bacterium]
MTLNRLIISLLLIVVIPGSLIAQHDTYPEFYRGVNYDLNKLDFYYTFLYKPSRETDNSKLEIYAKIPYNRLMFFQFEAEFRAEFDITIQLKNRRKRIIYDKTWTEIVRTKNFEETLEHRFYHLIRHSLPVKNGRYTLEISIDERETEKDESKSTTFDIPDYDDNEFVVSNIVLVENLLREEERIIGFIPSLSEVIETDDQKTHFAYFELTPGFPGERFEVEAELTHNTRSESETIISVTSEYSTRSETIPITFNITQNELKGGKYILKYRIRSQMGSEKETSSEFLVTSFGNPSTLEELESNVNIMTRIFSIITIRNIQFSEPDIWDMRLAFNRLKKEDLNKLTYDQKAALYNSIWKSLDPTPTTELNETKREFYRRVMFANDLFKGPNEGWETDRGMIFILFGPPNTILRTFHPDYSYPIQLWSYIRDNLRFEFKDLHNSNTYRLIRQIK